MSATIVSFTITATQLIPGASQGWQGRGGASRAVGGGGGGGVGGRGRRGGSSGGGEEMDKLGGRSGNNVEGRGGVMSGVKTNVKVVCERRQGRGAGSGLAGVTSGGGE